MSLKVKNKEIIFNTALVLGFFMPLTSIMAQLINGLLPLILFVLLVDKKKITLNKYAIVFFATIYISFTINIFIGDIITNKSIMRIFSFALLFLLFPFTSYVRVHNMILYGILLFIFLSQIAYVQGIGPLVSFFDFYFPYEGDRVGFSSDYLLQSAGDLDSIVNRRYGGLYHNPNQAVRYVSVVLTLFLIENKSASILRILPFITLAFISIILSGSRTGIIVLVVLVIIQYVFFRMKNFNIKFFLSLLLFMLFVMGAYVFTASFDLRIFNISSGVEGSIGTKIDWFFKFINQLDSSVRMLFGHYSTDNISKYGIILLDSEWGETIYCFGIVGAIVLANFYIHLYKTKDRNLQFCLLILLWGISSTVIFSFRMSFLFMLILSNYYSLYQFNKRKKLR
jgi:hypothetical protein